ncbi:helix-hairpin-helix domain-containing protein [Granulicella sp. S190]|uniref:helix-hairpin-helix domain-containing protein n=1 Tax=Granulicella sp. S190 TaxID=1747226 RepID=UPI00131DBA38|nr:PHP domain-containing protein [Granulicella sp. S190]
MDNISIARLLDETASLLEIDSADPFRIRSYRRAAEAVEQQTTQLSTLTDDPKALLAIPGIGKGMAANICFLLTTGTMPLREELLQKYKATMLDLLRLPGMGPKTVALVWSSCQVCDIDGLEAAAKAGHLTKLPRMGEKFVAKLLKGIEDHRKNSSRFRIDKAQQYADTISNLIRAFPGIDEITPAGSLRRGRETVGDLDLLVTGPACEPDVVSAAVEHVAALPLIDKLIAKGQNKVSFTLRNNLQVDVRLLPRASYGAALQYFTGSKMHNVALRQRAIKRGLTLSEYALLRLEDNVIVAAATEADIYNALDLDYIPPELRENGGELEAAANHTLPQLITIADIHGDLHMHTEATDGRDTIRQMAEAALARGLSYIAITDHSKNLAMTNGLDDTRALAHIKRIREVDAELQQDLLALNEALARDTPPKDQHLSDLWMLLKTSSSRPERSVVERPPHFAGSSAHLAFRILPGIEVDILADGSLDLADETLAQMDIVVASVHSHFAQPVEEMTARVLHALENPYVRILGHPTGRKVLGREPYAINIDAILKSASQKGVAAEHNASPARADLNDLHLRLAKQHGCKIVVNTDAHATEELDQMRYGITQLRRAWLSPTDILNTQPTAEDLLKNLRPKP